MHTVLRSLCAMGLLFPALSCHAQQTLDIAAGTSAVTSDEAATTYDRVEMARSIKKGEWTAMVFPANLDGYYFGPDAPRYRITSLTAGSDGKYFIDYEVMDAQADFQAGQAYLIQSQIDLDKVVHVVPGRKMAVVENSDLFCNDVTGNLIASNDTKIADVVLQRTSDANLPNTRGLGGKDVTVTVGELCRIIKLLQEIK